MHDADTNDNMFTIVHDCVVTLHDAHTNNNMTTSTDFHNDWAWARTIQFFLLYIVTRTRTATQVMSLSHHPHVHVHVSVSPRFALPFLFPTLLGALLLFSSEHVVRGHIARRERLDPGEVSSQAYSRTADWRCGKDASICESYVASFGCEHGRRHFKMSRSMMSHCQEAQRVHGRKVCTTSCRLQRRVIEFFFFFELFFFHFLRFTFYFLFFYFWTYCTSFVPFFWFVHSFDLICSFFVFSKFFKKSSEYQMFRKSRNSRRFRRFKTPKSQIWPHHFHISPDCVPLMKKVFSIVRKILWSETDSETAIWCIFMSVTRCSSSWTRIIIELTIRQESFFAACAAFLSDNSEVGPRIRRRSQDFPRSTGTSPCGGNHLCCVMELFELWNPHQRLFWLGALLERYQSVQTHFKLGKTKFNGILKHALSKNWIELMENRWNSSGKIQGSQHWEISLRIQRWWQHLSVNLSNFKEWSSCPCAMISFGRTLWNEQIVLRILWLLEHTPIRMLVIFGTWLWEKVVWDSRQHDDFRWMRTSYISSHQSFTKRRIEK